MQVGCLTHRDRFCRYVKARSREALERYFPLIDDYRKTLQPLRGEHTVGLVMPFN